MNLPDSEVIPTTISTLASSHKSKKVTDTIIFRKSSPSGYLTVFIEKLDFVADQIHSDLVQGVVQFHPDYIRRHSKIHFRLMSVLRYGPLEGNSFISTLTSPEGNYPKIVKQLYQISERIIPPQYRNTAIKVTKLQERILAKLGYQNCCPFSFQFPKHTPPTVNVEPNSPWWKKSVGVDYELVIYVADDIFEIPEYWEDSVGVILRKIRRISGQTEKIWLPLLPTQILLRPHELVSKTYPFSRNKLCLEVSLDKMAFHYGEPISVNIRVENNTKWKVNQVEIAIVQLTYIDRLKNIQHNEVTLATYKSTEGCSVTMGKRSLSKTYRLTPLMTWKQGIALDGEVNRADTKLASSTLTEYDMVSRGKLDGGQLEKMGITVMYEVQVKLRLGKWAGWLFGDVEAELPFLLMNKKIDKNERGEKMTMSIMKARQFTRNSKKRHVTFQEEDGEGDIIFKDLD